MKKSSGYLELQKYDKVLLKKVNNLIKDIVRNGYQCKEGKLEMLKGELSGYASVRIDKKNRLIFKDSEGRITIFACGNHYSDHQIVQSDL